MVPGQQKDSVSVSSLSPRESTPSADSRDQSDGIELKVDYPRKRRRLSSELEDWTPGMNESASTSTISRIRLRTSRLPETQEGDLVKPTTSNGKTVDASLSFATLGAAPWLIASLANMAITRPTGIQKACIPKILEGRDVIGGSKTGSGKTVAFTVPILQKWAEDPVGIFAVVLTPTR